MTEAFAIYQDCQILGGDKLRVFSTKETAQEELRYYQSLGFKDLNIRPVTIEAQ